MGAVSAILYAARDPSICGLVLDSPFSNMNTLAEELAMSHTKITGWVTSIALSLVSSSIEDYVNFDIKDLKPINVVQYC